MKNRAAFVSSSKTANTKTGVQLGLGASAGTNSRAEAKASSRKATTLAVAGSQPCSQSMATKQGGNGDTKSVLASMRLRMNCLFLSSMAERKQGMRISVVIPFCSEECSKQPPTNGNIRKRFRSPLIAR